eukprot:scaffold231841_cov47-Attheya_sp.AAC.2
MAREDITGTLAGCNFGNFSKKILASQRIFLQSIIMRQWHGQIKWFKVEGEAVCGVARRGEARRGEAHVRLKHMQMLVNYHECQFLAGPSLGIVASCL